MSEYTNLDKSFKSDFIEALDNIVCRLGQGLCTCNTTDFSDELVFACVERLEEEIIAHSADIFQKVHTEINSYITTFNVAPKNSIDECKTYFFIFQALSEQLNSELDKHTKQALLYTMVYIFNDLLSSVNASRESLNQRICGMIKNDNLFENTGNIGLYLIYKCLYNHAKENQNKS